MNPKQVFKRLFGGGNDAQRLERDARRKSVLDFVRAETADLQGKISTNDRANSTSISPRSATSSCGLNDPRNSRRSRHRITQCSDGHPRDYAEHLPDDV